jgi:hypothetical protein
VGIFLVVAGLLIVPTPGRGQQLEGFWDPTVEGEFALILDGASGFRGPVKSAVLTTYHLNPQGELVRALPGENLFRDNCVYEYDSAGRTVAVRWGTLAAPDITETSTYDSAGHLTLRIRRFPTGIEPGERRTHYHYDSLGRETLRVTIDELRKKLCSLVTRYSERGEMLSQIEDCRSSGSDVSNRHFIACDSIGRMVMEASSDRTAGEDTRLYSYDDRCGERFELNARDGSVTYVIHWDTVGTGRSRRITEIECSAERNSSPFYQFYSQSDAGGKCRVSEFQKIEPGYEGWEHREFDSAGRETAAIVFYNNIVDSADQEITRRDYRFAYNDQGDLVLWQLQTDLSSGTGPHAELNRQIERIDNRYDYLFDAYGNWTRRTKYATTSRGTSESGTVTIREITYYR